MTFKEFDQFQTDLFQECVLMRDTKGKEYANSASRFDNFDRLAKTLDLTNTQVAWVYTTKHLDSISQAIRTKQYTGRAESIRGRIVDAIVYLTLIAGMIEESEQVKKPIKRAEVAHNLDLTRCFKCKEIFKSGEAIWYYENPADLTEYHYSHTVCPSTKVKAEAAEA